MFGPEQHLRILSTDLSALKQARAADKTVHLPVAEFEFSSGKKGEIVISRGSAVKEGYHFMVVAAPGEDGTFSPQDVSDAVFQAMHFVKEHPELLPLSEDPGIGYQIAVNRGGMKKNASSPDHIQIIVPGSAEERKHAPRLTSTWPGLDL